MSCEKKRFFCYPVWTPRCGEVGRLFFFSRKFNITEWAELHEIQSNLTTAGVLLSVKVPELFWIYKGSLRHPDATSRNIAVKCTSLCFWWGKVNVYHQHKSLFRNFWLTNTQEATNDIKICGCRAALVNSVNNLILFQERFSGNWGTVHIATIYHCWKFIVGETYHSLVIRVACNKKSAKWVVFVKKNVIVLFRYWILNKNIWSLGNRIHVKSITATMLSLK